MIDGLYWILDSIGALFLFVMVITGIIVWVLTLLPYTYLKAAVVEEDGKYFVVVISKKGTDWVTIDVATRSCFFYLEDAAEAMAAGYNEKIKATNGKYYK